MNNNKVGFNNFKAFGSKMQYFSKKPITLVYGPNSIGKSSFLHAQLLFESFAINGSSELFNNNFAGDNLDIGDFKNYVHMHDDNKSINYKYIIDKKDNILQYIFNENFSTIKELYKNNFFDKELLEEQINTGLNSEYKESGINLSNLIEFKGNLEEFRVLNKKFHENKIRHNRSKLTKDELLREKQDIIQSYNQLQDQMKRIMFHISLSKHFNIDIDEVESFKQKHKEKFEQFLNSYLDIQDELKESNDDLYKFIKFTNTLNIKKIITLFNACKYLVNINKVNYNLAFQKDNITNIELYIDDNLYINKNNKIDTNSLIYLHIKELETTRETEGCTLVNNNLKSHLMTTGIESYRTVQYFSPLRPYPKREDMLQIDSIPSDDTMKEYIHTFTKNEQKILKFFTKQKYTLLKLPLLVWPKFLKLVYLQGGFNYFLSEEKKITSNGALTSNQLWIKLINNKELQQKISNWLSDKKKLKSTYKIRVDKTKVNYMDTIRPWDKDTLNDKAKDPISKAIDLFDNIFEKILIKIFKRPPSYLNELKFVDIRTDTEVTPRDMGLGISQVLPILISTFNSKEKLLYLEQPELHLHPAVQMEVMDEFIRSYKENNNEFMMETHSEHLLLRIMRRMRDTEEDKQDRDKSLDLTPDDVCLLYVDNDGESTYLQELRLSSKGKLLDHWPNGFFEEGFKERFS